MSVRAVVYRLVNSAPRGIRIRNSLSYWLVRKWHKLLVLSANTCQAEKKIRASRSFISRLKTFYYRLFLSLAEGR